jgi:hypothetical protein
MAAPAPRWFAAQLPLFGGPILGAEEGAVGKKLKVVMGRSDDGKYAIKIDKLGRRGAR